MNRVTDGQGYKYIDSAIDADLEYMYVYTYIYIYYILSLYGLSHLLLPVTYISCLEQNDNTLLPIFVLDIVVNSFVPINALECVQIASN